MTNPIEAMRKTAADYASARDRLAALVQAMKDEMSTIERGAMPDILRAARRISALHNDLAEAITEHPESFVKPRTVVVDGLKFGLQKQKGRMTWDNDDKLCARIDKLTEDGVITTEQAERCISVTYRAVAAGLEQLDARVLKRLGVTVTADTDAPIIKSVDGAVEKLVTSIVREATRDAGVAA
ncbi:MAG: hypothetical protein JSR68_08420 [Proteobacteria bacterium]|nr:hypothetical protein [Pseudomonadota bacterium]